MDGPLHQTIEELTELCSKQAAIIQRQAAALAQVGAEIEEDDRAGSGLLEED